VAYLAHIICMLLIGRRQTRLARPACCQINLQPVAPFHRFGYRLEPRRKRYTNFV
jgi:hypothetical protein